MRLQPHSYCTLIDIERARHQDTFPYVWCSPTGADLDDYDGHEPSWYQHITLPFLIMTVRADARRLHMMHPAAERTIARFPHMFPSEYAPTRLGDLPPNERFAHFNVRGVDDLLVRQLPHLSEAVRTQLFLQALEYAEDLTRARVRIDWWELGVSFNDDDDANNNKPAQLKFLCIDGLFDNINDDHRGIGVAMFNVLRQPWSQDDDTTTALASVHARAKRELSDTRWACAEGMPARLTAALTHSPG